MSDFDSKNRDSGAGGDSGMRRGGGGGKRGKFAKFGKPRKVTEPEEPLDYKNIAYLQKFVNATGKIVSRRRTGFSGQNQRKLAVAIKLARHMALMPFIGRG